MQEISLNVLDIAQNSISAKAKLISIFVDEQTASHTLEVSVEDDGCGMSEEKVRSVTDPFYTTRTTRRVGLGVPLFKMACEMTGGEFSIASKPGVGTTVKALFRTDSIDCMPLGDIAETIRTLITMNTGTDFVYRRSIDGREFTLDTRQLREILGDISFAEPEISVFIKQFIEENSPSSEEQKSDPDNKNAE